MCLWCVSVVRLIVATRSSGPPASSKIIKEMPGAVASGHPILPDIVCDVAYVVNVLSNKRNMQYYKHIHIIF
jgi:hypothetical protein